MSKSLKIIFLAVSGFVALLIFIAVALVVFVDANAYKPHLEAIPAPRQLWVGKSESTAGWGSAFSLAYSSRCGMCTFSTGGADIVTTKEAGIEVDLLSLLRKELQARNITLKQPRISIERDSDGTFNFEKPDAAGEASPALDLAKLSLSDGSSPHADKQSGEGFEAGDCSLVLLRLHLSSGQSRDIMKDLSFTGALACGEIRAKRFAASGLKVAAVGRDGVFDVQPVDDG